MSVQEVLSILIWLGLLIACTPWLGSFMARVYSGQRTWLSPVLALVEHSVYRVAGVDPAAEMDWRCYAREERVSATELKRGDLVVCEAGDVIPGDGEVVEGIASVDESAITGESAPVIRESGGDRSAVTGGTRVLSDRIIVRITSEQGSTFLDRMIALITGVLYPLAITLLAQTLFPVQANGSLIMAANRVVGSALIGQANQEARYFWPRPSAVNYMDGFTAGALGTSGASNLGPTNAALAAQVGRRDDAFRAANGLAADAPVPADMRFASGSGLDPHISPAAAHAQIDRVAHARGLDPVVVTALVEQHVAGPQFGLLGSPRVNVLQLNLALDEVQ